LGALVDTLARQLGAHEVGAVHQRLELVAGDRARQGGAQPAEGRDRQALGSDVLERTADLVGDLLGGLDLQHAVVDDADRSVAIGIWLAAVATTVSAGHGEVLPQVGVGGELTHHVVAAAGVEPPGRRVPVVDAEVQRFDALGG